jgi:hypothetical protein
MSDNLLIHAPGLMVCSTNAIYKTTFSGSSILKMDVSVRNKRIFHSERHNCYVGVLDMIRGPDQHFRSNITEMLEVCGLIILCNTDYITMYRDITAIPLFRSGGFHTYQLIEDQIGMNISDVIINRSTDSKAIVKELRSVPLERGLMKPSDLVWCPGLILDNGHNPNGQTHSGDWTEVSESTEEANMQEMVLEDDVKMPAFICRFLNIRQVVRDVYTQITELDEFLKDRSRSLGVFPRETESTFLHRLDNHNAHLFGYEREHLVDEIKGIFRMRYRVEDVLRDIIAIYVDLLGVLKCDQANIDLDRMDDPGEDILQTLRPNVSLYGIDEVMDMKLDLMNIADRIYTLMYDTDAFYISGRDELCLVLRQNRFSARLEALIVARLSDIVEEKLPQEHCGVV